MRRQILYLILALLVIFVVNIPRSGLRPPRKKTVVFVGTSYTRAIFFEAIKLVRQKDELDDDDMYIPSYTIQHAPGCNLPGKAGVDLVKCGPPGFRVVENDEYRFIYHFKTYLYTPWADGLMLDRITQELAGDVADLLVLGSAEWGTNKYLTNVTSREGQVEQFYNDYLSKIPSLQRIFIHNDGYNRSTKAMWDFYQRATSWSVYEMAPLLREMKQMKTGHGYYGYGTRIMFSHLMNLL